MSEVSFNKPFIIGSELENIRSAVEHFHLSGDGVFTAKCHRWLEENFKIKKALLTHSCTAALEMSAILCEVKAGDEVIVPAYTFVSTVNAFVLRGAKPVFVDIRPDTLNLDESLIENAITSATKVIVPVHYAGIGCEMDAIMNIAGKYGLMVVEDAAQGVKAFYKDRALGSIGQLGCYSFHETKNFISGEGGALAVNDADMLARAEIIREKGTNRSQFFRGEVDKYTWVDIGSSYLPSELIAAFLYAQLENSGRITEKRMAIWNYYNERLAGLEDKGLLKRPFVPEYCQHNGHMFYIIVENAAVREKLLAHLKMKNIQAIFHYVPLHTSPMAKKLGINVSLPVTDDMAERIVRLPCFFELTLAEQDRVVDEIENFFAL